MGLAELIKVGASLSRQTISIQTATATSGSASLGPTYGILAIETDIPCRVRLYDDLASLINAGEVSRTFGDTNVSASVALIGDFSMSLAATQQTVDPMLYSVNTGFTYYRIESAVSPPTIKVTRFLLEDSSITATMGTQYTTANRRTLPSISASLASNGITSGSLSDSTIPQTYLFVSASLSNSTHRARLRLYSYSSSLYDTTEKNRVFSTEPSSSARLLADIIMSGSEITNFTPKIIGANLQNMGNDLSLIRGNTSLISGENKLYYVLENVGASLAAITASLHVYSLED